MTILTFIGALALQTLPAPNTIQWEAVAEDSGGRYAIAPTGLTRDGDRVRLLMRAVAARTEPSGVSSAVVRYVIDCRLRTAAIEAADFYREDGTFAGVRPSGEI